MRTSGGAGPFFRRALLGASLLSLAVAAGCRQNALVETALAADRTTASVPVGGSLVVTLDANPSRNHAWTIDQQDQTALKLEKRELVKLDRESRYGGNMFRKFTFKALKPGQTELRFEFEPLFDEDDLLGSDTYLLEVDVTD